jgi:hypothetical protein
VHGPLALTLLLEAMSGHVRVKTKGQYIVESIEYRNLAPLYCDESMRLCGSLKKTFGNGELYDVWIEGPAGGVAVKGTVRTVRVISRAGDTDATERTPASAAKPSTHEPFSGSRVRKISTDPGEIVPATSLDRLKGVRHVKIRSSMADQTETPAPENVQMLDTAEDTGPSVRRSVRSVASVVPDLQPRTREQQETRSTGAHVVEPPKLSLSTFAIPPAPSASEAPPSEAPPSEAPPSEAPPSEAHPSPMLRPESNHTRQPLSRITGARQTKVTPKTGPLVRKYAGTPYIYNPTDVADRHNRYMKKGITKVSHLSVRRTAQPDSPRSPTSVWQRPY